MTAKTVGKSFSYCPAENNDLQLRCRLYLLLLLGWLGWGSFTLCHLPDLGQYHHWRQRGDKPSHEIDPHEKTWILLLQQTTPCTGLPAGQCGMDPPKPVLLSRAVLIAGRP